MTPQELREQRELARDLAQLVRSGYLTLDSFAERAANPDYMLPINFGLNDVACVVALMQLALRHPALPETIAAEAHILCNFIIERVESDGMPAYAQLKLTTARKYICARCGTSDKPQVLQVSLHSNEFTTVCSGWGEVRSFLVPRCPKCEPESLDHLATCVHVPTPAHVFGEIRQRQAREVRQ